MSMETFKVKSYSEKASIIHSEIQEASDLQVENWFEA